VSLSAFDVRGAPLDAGTTLLEASAGTGKTYTLVGLLLRLLVEGRIERLDQALVVTFTVAATDELKNRLRAALHRTLRAVRGGDEDPLYRDLAGHPEAERRLREALDDFDRVAVATIHGFCKRLLDEAAFESCEPFAVDFLVDPLPLLHRAAADALRTCYTPGPSALAAVVRAAGLSPATLVNLYQLWRRYPDVALDPADPDPEPPLAELGRQVAAAVRAFDASAAAQLAAAKFLAGKGPFDGPVAGQLARFAERLGESPWLCLDRLAAFARGELLRTTHQRGQPPYDHPFFVACDHVAAARDAAVLHLRAALLLRLHERLEAEKRLTRTMSFDDLIARTHAALHDPARSVRLRAAVRSRYRVALIDEFQDTDSLQYGIFATCFAGRPLFFVGDPKQSIYGFRGADLHAYLGARTRADRQATLAVNHRSCADLVRAVGVLFGRADAFVTPGIRLPAVSAAAGAGALALGGDGPALRFRCCAADRKETRAQLEDRIARDVAAEISRLLRASVTVDGAPLQPRHVAVLTRLHRQATAVQDALREAGIVAAIGKAGDVFDTDESSELETLLRALLQPRDLLRARAAMATRLWGRSAAELAALDADEPAFDRELERLEGWRQLWSRRGFVAMLEQAFADLGTVPRLLQQRRGERRLTNCRQLAELLHEAEHQGHLSPDGLFEWLQRERTHPEGTDSQRRELRLESDEDAVQILTVHGSKGLQYEIVFCPFLWDHRQPKGPAVLPAGSGRRLAFDAGDDPAGKRLAEAEQLGEDVRLAYVAVTRARRRCYVHWAPGGPSSHRSALAWLLSPHRPARSAAGALADDWLEVWSEQVKADRAAAMTQLAEFVAAAPDVLGCDAVPQEPVAVPCRPPPGPAPGPARRPARAVRALALHSFSSIVHGAAPVDPAPDVDGLPPRSGPSAGAGIHGFARGAAAGTCLHAILEQVDLRELGPRAADRVRAELAAAGLLEPAAHQGVQDPVATVLQNLRDLAAATAGPGGPALASIAAGARAAEWSFTLPATHAELPALAELFARSSSAVARDYAGRLRQLPQKALRGFLVGFVDLVAEHQGRYWVIDWKSNHLGETAADYDGERLRRAMHEHDYVLQYHLYLLALHRQLAVRLPDYDCERQLGGVCYAFLRGATPGSDQGMFCDRVPPDLVRALDRWIGSPRGGGR